VRAKQQIPCWNDRKKSKSNGKINKGEPAGMTERKA
jgi:hypothetical protein